MLYEVYDVEPWRIREAGNWVLTPSLPIKHPSSLILAQLLSREDWQWILEQCKWKLKAVGQSQHFQKSKHGKADQLLASYCQEWWVHVFLQIIVMPFIEFQAPCSRKRYPVSVQCLCKHYILLSACWSLMEIISSTEIYSACPFSCHGPVFVANKNEK